MPTLLMLLAITTVGQAQAKVDYHTQLDGAWQMPVVVSPDGGRLLYFTREMHEVDGESLPKYSYKMADRDGSNQRTVFETAVEWESALNSFMSDAVFSADGQRIAVATTDNGRPLRDGENPGRAIPAIVDAEGKSRNVKCELGSCGGFGFAGDDLLVLETPSMTSGEGYRLTMHGKGEPKVIHADAKQAASCLRISPTGGQAVFFISQHISSSIVRLRFVDLTTGKVHDSPEFRSQWATFEGRPQLFWSKTGDGVYCHVSTQQRSKYPFELTHYNFRTGKGEVVAPARNMGASCWLGERLLALWDPDEEGCTVWDWGSKTKYPLPDHNYIIGGRGNHVVVADLERDAVYAATIELRNGGFQPP